MSKCFIEGMGGGAGKLFAAIGVTYPEGSTLTCTDGTKTLKAKTTTGQWVFSIPCTGTWTVTATDGTNTKSKSVEITEEGQFESVVLTYALVLFDNGEGAENWVGTADHSTYTAYSIGTTLYVGASPCGQYVKAKITLATAANLANYNTLNIEISDYHESSTYPNYVTLYIYIGTTQYGTDIASQRVRGTGTVSLDVSALTGTYYISLIASASNSLSGNPRYYMVVSDVRAIQ